MASSPSCVLPATQIGRPGACSSRQRRPCASMPAGGWKSNLMLPVTWVRPDVAPIELEALGVGLALGRDHDAVRERLAKQRDHAPVLADRARRDARARKHERHAAAPAFAVQVRPQLGLEDHRELRLHAVEEAPDRPRQVERHVAQVHAVAEQQPCAGGAGRRDGGEQDAVLRVALLELRDQRLGRLHFPDRHGVDPDRGPGDGGPQAEALAEPLAVARIAQAAPQLHQDGDGRREVDEDVIEVVHRPHASCARRRRSNPACQSPTSASEFARLRARRSSTRPLQAPGAAQPAAVEVEDPDLPLFAEHDVPRIEVGVLHAGVVESAETTSDRGPACVVHRSGRKHRLHRSRAREALRDEFGAVRECGLQVAASNRGRHRQPARVQRREQAEFREGPRAVLAEPEVAVMGEARREAATQVTTQHPAAFPSSINWIEPRPAGSSCSASRARQNAGSKSCAPGLATRPGS